MLNAICAVAPEISLLAIGTILRRSICNNVLQRSPYKHMISKCVLITFVFAINTASIIFLLGVGGYLLRRTKKYCIR